MIRALLRAASAAAIIGAIVACADTTILTPATGPGTQYPCGLNGHECSDGLCCPESSACCDGTYCPDRTCEFVGGGMRAPDAGPTLVPQYRPAP